MDTTAPFWITSNRVIIDGNPKPAGIFVSDGCISQISTRDEALKHSSVRDFGDLCIMAGVVDSHVHVNEPGRVEWEGFVSATKAATAGGVTTIVDMPLNSSPVTTSLQALETKIASLPGKLWCDLGLLGGIIPGNENEILPMIERGVVGFKCFTVFSGIDEFPHVSEKDALKAMKKLKKAERPVVLMFHAEAPDILDTASEKLKKLVADPTQYQTFLNSRPASAEEKAIHSVINLCNQTGVRSHIVHLSAGTALDLLQQAQQDGVNISVETTPHYLYFTSEEVPAGATLFKCCPPVRPAANKELLWKGIKDGIIGLVASDHSPCTVDLKNLDTGSFETAWGGIGSLQLALSIVWTEAKERGFTLNDISRLMCQAPAKLVGFEKKGSIKVGNDADFAVWDPDQEFVVEESSLFMKNSKTPYLGRKLFGKVDTTIVRGQVVFQAGKGHSEQPLGRWVPR